MASSATCLTSSSSSSWLLNQKFQKDATCSISFHFSTRFAYLNLSRLVSISKLQSSASSWFSSSLSYGVEPGNRARVSVVLGAIDAEEIENHDDVTAKELKKLPRPCELYVCNLPRSCDIAELVELFKPFGTVLSAEHVVSQKDVNQFTKKTKPIAIIWLEIRFPNIDKLQLKFLKKGGVGVLSFSNKSQFLQIHTGDVVSRNVETGKSRGCGYVTMGSINSAKIATAALDGSDFGGRELRIRFSVDMNLSRRNLHTLSSSPKKNIIYESPHKVYVGNLEWNVQPGDLRNLFSQFGVVVSAKVLHDRRASKNRVYGFLSYGSAAERDASIVLNGTEFRGRKLVVKLGSERTET